VCHIFCSCPAALEHSVLGFFPFSLSKFWRFSTMSSISKLLSSALSSLLKSILHFCFSNFGLKRVFLILSWNFYLSALSVLLLLHAIYFNWVLTWSVNSCVLSLSQNADALKILHTITFRLCV
jgi:hypothetical protein